MLNDYYKKRMFENDMLAGTQIIFGTITYLITKDMTSAFACAAGLALAEAIRTERSAPLYSMFTMAILAILANVGHLDMKSVSMVSTGLLLLCFALFADAIKKDKGKQWYRPNKALRNLCGIPVFGPRFATVFGKIYRKQC